MKPRTAAQKAFYGRQMLTQAQTEAAWQSLRKVCMDDMTTTTAALTAKDAMPYFDAPVQWKRTPDKDGGGEWVKLTFAAGGEVLIYTRNPLVWIEPQSH